VLVGSRICWPCLPGHRRFVRSTWTGRLQALADHRLDDARLPARAQEDTSTSKDAHEWRSTSDGT
jgi:hypothetical protein